MLLRLTSLTVTNTFAALRLLPMGDRDKGMETLVLRHQITVLERQLGADARVRFAPADRAFVGVGGGLSRERGSGVVEPDVGLEARQSDGGPTSREGRTLAIGYQWITLSVHAEERASRGQLGGSSA